MLYHKDNRNYKKCKQCYVYRFFYYESLYTMDYSQFCTNSMAKVIHTQVIRKECSFRVASTFVCHNSIIFLPSNLHFPILFIFSPNSKTPITPTMDSIVFVCWHSNLLFDQSTVTLACVVHDISENRQRVGSSAYSTNSEYALYHWGSKSTLPSSSSLSVVPTPIPGFDKPILSLSVRSDHCAAVTSRS